MSFSRLKTTLDSTKGESGYSSAQVRAKLASLHDELGGTYATTADHLDMNVGIIWELLNGVRDDSPQLRRRLQMPKKKRFRLCADFATAEDRARFRREVLRGDSMTEWVMRQWRLNDE